MNSFSAPVHFLTAAFEDFTAGVQICPRGRSLPNACCELHVMFAIQNRDYSTSSLLCEWTLQGALEFVYT